MTLFISIRSKRSTVDENESEASPQVGETARGNGAEQKNETKEMEEKN